MPHVLVRHKVESYAKWRPVFDEHASTRRAAGVIGEPQIFRSGDDPWEVLVLMEWDDLEKARKFMSSSELSNTMDSAGVVDVPTIYFLNMI